MTNNYITSQGQLLANYVYSILRQWVALRMFVLKQFLNGTKLNIATYCVIDGRRAIVYKRGLATTDSAYLDYLAQFANEFDITLQEDRRVHDVHVAHDRRRCPLMIPLFFLIVTNNIVSAANDRVNDNEDNGRQTQEQNITQLLNWVRFKMSQLEFEVGPELPVVQRLPKSKMYQLAFGDNVPRISSHTSANIYGLYNYENKTIYMLDSIDINTIKGKAILLHELVHFLQYQNGHDHRVECKNRLEYLAYYLEAEYLKEHGKKVGFSRNHLRSVVQCQS